MTISEGAAVGRGLTTSEARALLRQYGPNVVRSSSANAWRVLLRQLKSPLLLLLAGTAFISYLVGQRSDAIIIGLILAASVGLGFVNEYQAARAAVHGHHRALRLGPRRSDDNGSTHGVRRYRRRAQ